MNNKESYCLNCNESFVDLAKYCHNCGQSKRASILSLRELWTNFWNTILNVDNSFFRTLLMIARPSRLTKMYVAGKRKKYINPIRLFLIMFVFLIGAMSGAIGDFGNNSFIPNLYRSYHESLLLEKFENEVSSYELGTTDLEWIDEIKANVFRRNVCPENDTMWTGVRLVDFGSFQRILKKDFIDLSEEEIYEKYDANTFFEKLNYRQYLRINKDQGAANRYLFTNAGWGLVPSILVLCLFLKLLYRNFQIPYLEHLVLVVNTHSFFFLIGILISLTFRITDHSYNDSLIPILFSFIIIFPVIIIYKYYKEGPIISLVKYLLAAIIYLFASAIFLIISMLISGFIF